MVLVVVTCGKRSLPLGLRMVLVVVVLVVLVGRICGIHYLDTYWNAAGRGVTLFLVVVTCGKRS